MRVVAVIALLAMLGCVLAPRTGYAQQPTDTWTYRARVSEEVTATRPDAASPFASALSTPDRWTFGHLVAATADTTYGWRDRLHFGAGIGVRAGSGQARVLRISSREAYARWSALSWLDVEAGQRIVRWGTGYAFTPTGVLDPPRDAIDPQDRLGLSQGTVMVKADAYKGSTSVTFVASAPRVGQAAGSAAPERLYAGRVRTTLRGLEVALVGAAAARRRPSWGANVSHVIGDRLEWHGELLSREDRSVWRAVLSPEFVPGRGRTIDALAGMQYTFSAGTNLVLEYYRDGNGLTSAQWDRLVAAAVLRRDRFSAEPSASSANLAAVPVSTGTMSPAGRPGGHDFLFTRLSAGSVNATFSPDLIVILGLNDGGVVLVPTFSWAIRTHVQTYARAVVLTGAGRSASGSAPVTATITVGVAVRF